jgi:uncharacterized protein YjbI with pentapeptide repeats
MRRDMQRPGPGVVSDWSWLGRWGGRRLALAVAVAVAVFLLLLWRGAFWLDNLRGLTPDQRESAVEAFRGLLIQVGAGTLAAGALVFTARNFLLTREGHITDRYTKAIDQLGSDRLSVRLGAIYALERIMIDSQRDHPTVVEVLAAFVREHARNATLVHEVDPSGRDSRAPEQKAAPASALATDVQAALTVIGRRPQGREERGCLNLRGAVLANADLTRANLTGVDLTHADLAGATMIKALVADADLRQASLADADLTYATLRLSDLDMADLRHADLTLADLTGATLRRASLGGAVLLRASLDGAVLSDADLTGANLNATFLPGADLTRARLDKANLIAADLTGATMHEATLNGAWLTVPGVAGADANLTGVEMADVDLTHARAAPAQLADARLALPGSNAGAGTVAVGDLVIPQL